MRLAKEKQTVGMLPICEDMITKTRILLSLWDPGLVEEALNFIEEHKLIATDDSGVSEDFSLENTGRPNLILSPFKRITQQLTSLDLKSPDLDDFATPCTPREVEDIWKVPSDNSQHNVQDLQQNLLRTSECVKSLCKTIKSPDESNFVIFPDCDDNSSDLMQLSDSSYPSSLSNSDDLKPLEPEPGKLFLDTHVMCSSPSANYYKPTDEPEPWDLTQLNIEASVMCLVSKVKFLCGRCGSPAVRLRQNQRTTKRSIITNQPGITSRKEMPNHELCKEGEAVTRAVNCVTKAIRNGNKFTDGLDLTKIVDWAAELRPAMRKLRHAMDGLLKTARLTHSVFRVQEDPKAAQRVCNVQYRRDVCFSQAVSILQMSIKCTEVFIS